MTQPDRVLIVEHEAWRREGHYMRELEAVAIALRDDDHDVHVLAASRLAIEDEGRTIDGVTVHFVSRWLWFLQRLADRIRSRGARFDSLRRPAIAVSRLIQQPTFLAGVISAQRQLDGVPALIMTRGLRFEWAALLAPRTSRWAVYELAGRPATNGWIPAQVWHIRSRLMEWREASRRRHGGWVRLVCNNDVAAISWQRDHPSVCPAVVPLAGAAAVEPAPKGAARAELGLDPDDVIALAFGRTHNGRDTATVFRAFEGPTAPARLVVAGEGFTVELDKLVAKHPSARFPHVSMFEGTQSDARKHALHSAADYVVLSFTPGLPNDSGSLADAMSYGLPVCCSDPSGPAVLVRQWSLGLLYDAGDASSLRAAAAEMARFRLDEVGRARFIDERSTVRIARRLFELTVRS